MSATENFRAAMRAEGLDYAGPIQADGRLHRFKAEGDHARNSWYVLHDGTPAAGAFGCWKRGFKKTWCDRDGSLSPAEWQAVRQRWEAVEHEREQSETARHAKARSMAAWIFKRSQPARPQHPYLSQKDVKIFGDLREWRGALVLPLRDAQAVKAARFLQTDDLRMSVEVLRQKIADCGGVFSLRHPTHHRRAVQIPQSSGCIYKHINRADERVFKADQADIPRK